MQCAAKMANAFVSNHAYLSITIVGLLVWSKDTMTTYVHRRFNPGVQSMASALSISFSMLADANEIMLDHLIT